MKKCSLLLLSLIGFSAYAEVYICMSRYEKLELNLDGMNSTLVCRDRLSREFTCNDFVRNYQDDGVLTNLEFKSSLQKDLVLTFQSTDVAANQNVLFGFLGNDSIQCQMRVN